MPRLFYGNFDFEYQLAGLKKSPPALQRITDELAFCWIGIASSDDIILTNGPVDTKFEEQLTSAGLECPRFLTLEQLKSLSDKPDYELVPWGWTEETLKFAESHQLRVNAPPIESVRLVNDRQWAAEQEFKITAGNPISRIIHSLEELHQFIEQFCAESPHKWMVKSCWGMSGRDRVNGTRHFLTDPTRNWISKQLNKHGAVIWEPFLNEHKEVGFQFEIPKNSEPVLIDVVPMLVDSTGQYRGSWLLPINELRSEWENEIKQSHELALSIQATGYIGPVGIDVMRYHLGNGEFDSRICQDINARYTMGRMTSGFRRYLKPDELAYWKHRVFRDEQFIFTDDGNQDDIANWWEGCKPTKPDSTRLVHTSPLKLNDELVKHQTVLSVGPDIERYVH